VREIQAFFSLPFFSDEVNNYGPGQFWIYWAVTAPLTVLVIGAYIIWNQVINPLPAEKSVKIKTQPMRIKSWRILSRRTTQATDKQAA
jgi:hypothetical protein